MAITRYVSGAPAAIRAKLTKIAGTNSLYTHADIPGIILREIPAGSLTQFGGFINIQRTASAVRTIGAAGLWLSKFPSQSLPGACMHVNFGGSFVGNGPLTGRGNVTTQDQKNLNYQLSEAHPTAVELTNTNKTGSDINGVSGNWVWDPVNVLDELLLGWVCPVNSAVIWQGDVWLQHDAVVSSEPSGNYRFVSGVTMAAHVDLPLAIDWSQVDLATMKTNYVLGTDVNIRPFVSDAWDQCLPALKRITTLMQPFPVLYSAKGLELSPNFARHLCLGGYAQYALNFSSYICPFLVTGGGTMAPDASAVPQPYGGTVGRLPASSLNGLVMPRFPTTRSITPGNNNQHGLDAFYYAVDPPFVSTNAGFPGTITGLPAAPLLGPIFPGVYAADALVHPAGDLAMSSIITILGDNTSVLQDPVTSSVPGNGTTVQGDASIVNEGQPFTTLNTTLLSWNYGVDVTMKTFVQSVRAKAEALARAKKSTFGF